MAELRAAQLLEKEISSSNKPQDVLGQSGKGRWRLVARIVGWFLAVCAALLSLIFLVTYFTDSVPSEEQQGFFLGAAILVGMPGLLSWGLVGWGRGGSG